MLQELEVGEGVVHPVLDHLLDEHVAGFTILAENGRTIISVKNNPKAQVPIVDSIDISLQLCPSYCVVSLIDWRLIVNAAAV